MKRKHQILILIIFIFFLFIKAQMDFNPSIRVLLSIVDFSESTLTSSDYLAYGIDLKDLFRNYTNSDINYRGSAYIKKIKGFPYSISGSIEGQRSPEQKKFSCESNLNVLVLNVGMLNAYAKDDTVYLVAPMLGGLSYGFDTNDDLFPKAPNLNYDITREWFHENKMNIWNFVRSIDIKETDQFFIDTDGTKAKEYAITIPQGEGDFIWELLGVDAPDHDIKCSLFLDKWCHTRKVVFDLSYKTEGAYIAIYGNDCNSMEIYAPLPDDESFTCTIKRDGTNNYTNAYINNITYSTSGGNIFSIDSNGYLNYTEEGFKLELSDIQVKKNNEVLAEGYVKGRISKDENMGDVFENAGVDFSNIEVIDWDTIKNDTASFVDDVIEQARKNVDLFDF
ncbi:hypothetical protein [Pseudobutyrivibrio sp.]|uniref:hypothetical protein n=1 Tax=Pseudobutyrivibrio sp. TaxID=2014367 RepID=UPI0025E50621|nr:hypothetical protein [Pseudobutyrivibrio sp.]